MRDELRNMKKASDVPMVTYLNKIKGLYDLLATSGRDVDNLDIINTVTDGLEAEYDGFITSMHMIKEVTFDRRTVEL